MFQGRRLGSPIALETKSGWVLAGSTDSSSFAHHVVAHHVSLMSGDDILHKFWELGEKPTSDVMSPEERLVM